MELQALIDHYGILKNEANNLYSTYKDLMVRVAEVREELQFKLNDSGLQSAKSKEYGVTIASKPNITIQNEALVIDWLNNTPNIEPDAYIGLKTTAFKTLALQVLKETGEVIDGTDVELKDTLSIRKNK